MEIIVIGVSAGGLEALATILPHIPQDFLLPILIVQHVAQDANNFLVEYLNDLSAVEVVEAQDKMKIYGGKVYIAPPNYHMLTEDKHTIALSADPKVNYSRPSIDVLFESVADVFKNKAVGIVLTGANSDGMTGAQKIKKNNGFIIVQNPETAIAKMMPNAVIKNVKVDKILDLQDIGPYLKSKYYG